MATITLNGTLPLGKLLQMYRQFAEIDQTEMGRRIGASRPTISAWERGEREPSFSQVVTWARVTGQPLETLVEAVNAGTAPAEAEAVPVLSQHSVRHEGFEPPTFWLGDTTGVDESGFVINDALDAEYEALCIVEAVAL